MIARRWELAGLIAGLCVLVALAIADGTAQRAHVSTYSTYDTRPNGYRALYETLARSGVRVSRFEGELGQFHARSAILVVASNEVESANGLGEPLFDDANVKRLKSFVRAGGRLVVLDGRESSLRAFGLDRGLHDAFAPALRDVRGEPVRGTAARLFGWTAQPSATPLLFAPDGLGALVVPLGRGSITAILAPNALSNKNLLRDRNLAFAYRLLARGDPVAFDERVHGYSQVKSLWGALAPSVHAAIWLALAIVALALVDGNVRFAPALPLDAPDERDSSAYIDSMASLLRRARAGRVAVERLVADTRARLRAGRRPDARAAVRVAELERILAVAEPSDAMLLQAARAYNDLRKDLQ